MQLARVALLLVVSVPMFADRFVPRIFARHRPMHPDNAQTVTFESSLAANGQLIERMEQKSDLVLDSLQRAEDEKAKQKKRW